MARLTTGGGARSGSGVLHPKTKRRTGVFANPIAPPTQTFTRAAARAGRRAGAAMPKRQFPHVPVIKNPTPAQTRAATHRLATGITRQVGSSGSARDRLARRQQIYEEIANDPRYAATRRAIQHYTAAAERHTAAAVAKAYGVPGGKGNRIRAGRQILAERAARDRVSAGQAPLKIQVAGLGITPGNLLAAAQSVTSLGGASPENSFVKKIASDVGTLGTAPFVGGYSIGKAALHDARAGVFANPANLITAPNSELRKLGVGILKGYEHEVTHPVQSFSEHPLLTLLDLAGAESVLGRTAGAVTRGVSRGRVGSTVRSPLATVNDAGAPGLVERSYSKDLFRQAFQRGSDALRDPVLDSTRSSLTVERGGRRVPVLQAHDHSTLAHPFVGEKAALLNKRADFLASRANSVERMVRDQASHEMRVRGVRGRNARDLVSMVVEGTITSAKHFREDLESHARRLRGVLDNPRQFRDTGELEAARNRLKLVESALNNPRVMAQAEKIVAAGESIGRRLNEVERQAIDAGILHGKRAARSRLVPAAIEHLGARYHSGEEIQRLMKSGQDIGPIGKKALKHGAIRHADGKFMSNADVEDFLKSRGRDPETVAYLPHREMGRGAFHAQFRPGGRPVLDNAKSRTGEAYRRGSTESSAELIRAQGVRQQVQLAKAQQLDRLVTDHGMRHPAVAKAERGETLTKAERKVVDKGGYYTAHEAEQLAQRIEHDTGKPPVLVTKNGTRLVAMRAFGAKLDKETQKIIREDLQGPGAMDSLSQRLLNDKIVTDFADTRARNVVLVPAEMVERLNAHLKPAGDLEKFFQFLNRPFRMAVLPQPRWLTGNFVEPYIVRLTAEGSGLNVFGLGVDLAAQRKILGRMERSGDPRIRAAAREVRAHQLGGLFIGRRGASNRREVSEFMPRAAQQAYGKMVSRLPVTHQMVEATRTLGSWLVKPLEAFFIVNRVIESTAQKAAVGRQLRRDIQEFTGSWAQTVRLGQKAVDEAVKGLTGTATQQRFMEAQHELLGKYEGFSPRLRSLIQGPMPFLPWSLNAARFVYWTMPVHHSALTSLLVRTNDVVAKDWAAQHEAVKGLKGGLGQSIPNGKGGWIDVERYTPYGLTGPIAGGDLSALTDSFFPQAQGLFQAVHGKDPFGNDLRVSTGDHKPTQGQELAIAGNSLAESIVPYMAMIRRLREGGATPYADSTVFSPKPKPGTSHGMSAVRRTFDPFRPTYVGSGGGGPVTAAPPSKHPEDAAFDAALQAVQDAATEQAAQDAAFDQALEQLRRP